MGNWDDWVGKTRTVEDEISLATARAMAATLGWADRPSPERNAPIQYPWVWTHFLEIADRDQIGSDGHPKRGGFLPPIPNPRRMWAGSRCNFSAPLLAGQRAERRSTVTAIEEKHGSAGPMVFVTVLHEIASGGTAIMREEQDIVYMDIPDTFQPPTPKPVPECSNVERVQIDPVFLFRFSALTFNGHRIHYDRTYAKEVEKYPGLVVHGPLQATLLFDFATRTFAGRVPASFSFRGMRPLFDFDDLTLNARENESGSAELFAANGEGAITMKATMEWVA